MGQESTEHFGSVEAMAAMASLMKDFGKDAKWPVRVANMVVCQAECSSALSFYVLDKS